MKDRLLYIAFSSCENFCSDWSLCLTTSEFKVYRYLSKNKSFVIYKADKGSTIVILDKTFYINSIEEILNDYTKCASLDIPTSKEINYIRNLDKRITPDLKVLKMDILLIRLLIRILNQLGLDQVFYTG